MEEFNLDLTLDEAAVARIAHVDFLNRTKDWALGLAELLEPFSEIARILMDDDSSETDMLIIKRMFPLGLSLTYDKMNEFYELMQNEAVEQLGAPFQLHGAHHPLCEDNGNFCGHQDHYMPKDKDDE